MFKKQFFSQLVFLSLTGAIFLTGCASQPDPHQAEQYDLEIRRGHLYAALSKFDVSAMHYQKALGFVSSDDVPARLKALGWAADALQTAGKYDPAQELYQTAIRLAKSNLPGSQLDLLTLQNNLAQLFQATGRLAKAEALMKSVIKDSEHLEGADISQTLSNLAVLYYETDRLDLAEPMMRRVLTVDEEKFGPNHPEVAIDLNNLAQLYADTDRYDLAEALMLRALKIEESSVESTDGQIATSLNNLAIFYFDQNQIQKAERLLERAVDIGIRKLGKKHPQTLIYVENLEAVREVLTQD
ncbi:MAG: hypothetical protein COB59_02825 [Rhodospirillaceae bacterium]|nr:MAG: hypothetical protein COB59_02825 [Rhodospirillaceae bacterium]